MECGTEVAAPAPVVEAAVPAPVSERRITTVLFGDLVGFTSLSESRDAEDVRELLTRYFDGARLIVERHGGTIEKFIGDAVMAVWGVPSTHEDDAERAVRAGLELVEMARALSDDAGTTVTMRVGLVTGEVATTVGATGQGMVAGDAVNTASRVQSAAEPGQVWVDENTKKLTSAAIAYQDVGEHALKGKAQPMRLFAVHAVVASVRGVERVDGLEAPIVGRDRELRMLKELFHGVEDRGRPALVLVEGEAGVGKTRLGWEFEKYIDGLSATVRWHRGRCLAYGEGVSFWALAEAIRARFGLVERDSPDVVATHFERGLQEFVPDDDERAWLRPRVAVLLGIDTASTFTKDELAVAWTLLLERIGSDGPVVLVVDDAQHADDGLLDFVAHLLSRASFGIFVLMLARPGIVARRPDLAGHPRVTVLHLAALEPPDMARLVDGLVLDLPSELRPLLVGRSEGIPLYAVETVRALIDRDLVVPRDGQYVVAPGATIDLDNVGAPASLQTLVAARLDALSPDERRVVADGSVLGLSFSKGDITALVDGVGNIDEVISSLVRKQVLELETDRFSAERGQLRFVQAVVRQVAYDTITRRDRRDRHLAVAAHLEQSSGREDDEAAVIAQHYLDAAEMSTPDDPRRAELLGMARDHLVAAARRSSALGSPASALRDLERALALIPDDAGLGSLHELAAQAAFDAGRYEASAEHAAAAERLYADQGNEVAAGRTAAIHGRALRVRTSSPEASIVVLRPYWDRLSPRTDADEAIRPLAIELAACYRQTGQHELADDLRRHALRLTEATGDRAAVGSQLISMAIDHANDAPMLKLILLRAAADIGAEIGNAGLRARALLNIGSSEIQRDASAALDVDLQAVAAAERCGGAMELDFARLNCLLASWVRGQWNTLPAMLEVVQASTSADVRLIAAVVRAWLADATEPAPTLPAWPDDWSAEQVESLDRGAQAWADQLTALRHRHDGQPAEAARCGIEAVRKMRGFGGLSDDFVFVWPTAVHAAIDAGLLDEAAELVRIVADAPAGHRTPALSAHLHAGRGRWAAARGDEPQAIEHDLRAAVELFTTYGSPPLVGQAEEFLGRWLVGQRQPAAAAEHLARARVGFEELGALGWLAAMDAQPVLAESSRG
jgi:class 3 adenylate cyclase/tetratricopeptide (TPR) repeat protein